MIETYAQTAAASQTPTQKMPQAFFVSDRQQGNRATGQQGNRATGQQGNRATGQQGNYTPLLNNRVNYPIAYIPPKIRLLYGLLSLVTLLAGMVIYLLFRDLHNMILFMWIPKPEFLKTILVPLQPSIFTDFLRYHLPDMLWFVSAILFFRFIWFDNFRVQKIYIISFYVFGIVFEISQLSENVPGTFDWLDLFFMGITALFEGLLYKTFVQRRLK